MALLLPLDAGGCGSSEEAPLTKKQFIAKGEEICRDAKREQFRLRAKTLKRWPNAEETHLVKPAAVPAMEREIRRLKALNPPVRDEKKLQEIFRGLENGVADSSYDPLDLLVRVSEPFAIARKLERHYGFKVCATTPWTPPLQ
ncbi:MAG: hypothetical protein ACTHKT_00040 [Solirubrobacterales bacterium]